MPSLVPRLMMKVLYQLPGSPWRSPGRPLYHILNSLRPAGRGHGDAFTLPGSGLKMLFSSVSWSTLSLQSAVFPRQAFPRSGSRSASQRASCRQIDSILKWDNQHARRFSDRRDRNRLRHRQCMALIHTKVMMTRRCLLLCEISFFLHGCLSSCQ